ncbi:MAG: dihydropteroate synthase [Acidobacteriota bacterium]|nr:dihydropteroate synthase [Pyrinomonadaceae bacterium]MDW8303880.1 dihydropteroate synthase [Acidobacteriota bacterium]
MIWETSKRKIQLQKAIVMGILNVTPDSFSDGGRFFSVEEALKQAEKMISEGATIIDVGGESTRPGSTRVDEEEELRRTIPVIEQICKRFDVAVSIDTTKWRVAKEALEAGAEIVNDISGLRFDERISKLVAEKRAGLVLMHSRGSFETMHTQQPVPDILSEVVKGLKMGLEKAFESKVKKSQIVLDVGLGFGKTPEQNLELLAKLEKIQQEFSEFPFLIGPSRKSFIGKALGDVEVSERLYGTMATVAISVWKNAKIIRVHDVKPAVDTIKIIEAIKEQI